MKKVSFWIKLRNTVRRRLIAGLLIVVPLWLTFMSLRFFFRVLDAFFAPLVIRLFGTNVPGVGFVLLVVFLYVIGMTAANILGRSVIRLGENILSRIPLVKTLYLGTKQLIEIVSASRNFGFKRVVLVEYPRPGLRAVGFVTNAIQDRGSTEQFVSVFIPTAPNPTSGVFELVPEQ